MTRQHTSTLKATFETGDVPTEAQFGDLIDSQPTTPYHWVTDATAFNKDQCTFTLTSGIAEITDNTATGALVIPWTPFLATVGASAFNTNANITSLVIPPSVTSIENSAFYACTNVTGTLTIPNSVTTIGSSAFHYLDNLDGPLTIPNSVTSIGSNAFYYCPSLTDANIDINKSIIDNATNCFQAGGMTDIHVVSANYVAQGWTLGSGQTIGGVPNITVTADYTP